MPASGAAEPDGDGGTSANSALVRIEAVEGRLDAWHLPEQDFGARRAVSLLSFSFLQQHECFPVRAQDIAVGDAAIAASEGSPARQKITSAAANLRITTLILHHIAAGDHPTSR